MSRTRPSNCAADRDRKASFRKGSFEDGVAVPIGKKMGLGTLQGLSFFARYTEYIVRERNQMSKLKIVPTTIDDDIWAESWLARTYGGGPDECSMCFREGKLVKIKDCTNKNH